jgi:hypothetical protein
MKNAAEDAPDILTAQRGPRSRSGWIAPLALIALLVPWGFCGRAADETTAGEQAGPAPVRPGEFFGTVVAGGFRAVVIDYLWMRANIQEKKNERWELRATYDTLAYLQPHEEEVWVFNSSNIAILSTDYQTIAAKYSWLRAGLTYGVKGLSYNPDSEIIRRSLARMFYFRFSYDSPPYSRDFRRMMREDPDKSFLRDPAHPSPVHEALLYWDDLVKDNRNGDLLEDCKERAYAALVLLWEQETGKREARLDMLEAREKYLMSSPDVRATNRAIYDKRNTEYEDAVNAPKRLSDAEESQLRQRVQETLAYLCKGPQFNLALPGALATWETSCADVLRQIDLALDLYEKALNLLEASSGADPSSILDPAEVKTFSDRDVTDLLPVNGIYVTPIYNEVVRHLQSFTNQKAG